MDQTQIDMARWLGTLGFTPTGGPDWLTNGDGVTVRLPRAKQVHIFVTRDGVAWWAKYDDAPRQVIAATLSLAGAKPVMTP